MKTLIVILTMIPGIALANMELFPAHSINSSQLSDELVAAGYTCIISTSNRSVTDGKVDIDLVTGKPITVSPYIRLNCNETIDRATVNALISAHVPVVEPVLPTQEELRKQEIRAEAELMLRELGLIP